MNQIMGELLPEVHARGPVREALRLEFHHAEGAAGHQGDGARERAALSGRRRRSARIRQAKETNNQLKKEVEDARLRVHAEVIANWGMLAVLRTRHQLSRGGRRSQQDRARPACARRRRWGQRTTLDVLDAQRELLELADRPRDRS